jgi:alanyl aminopeptidase
MSLRLCAALGALLVACGPGAASTAPVTRPSTALAPDAGATPAAPAPAPAAVGFRLPAGARPLAYRVSLTVDPAGQEITGEGEIDLERDSAGGALYLNAHELVIESASLEAAGPGAGAALPLAATAVDAHMVAFTPATAGAALPAGRATLRLRWRARVRHEDTLGAFAQKTDDAWYLYTQFEPMGARRVLPCFDEPAFKVPWQLTLRVPRGQVALSNTPVVSQTDEGGLTRVTFAETPALPSYLVAFAIGPFEMLDAGASKGGAPIRVAVQRGHAAEATIPVEDTAPLLHLLEDYFGTPYPFAKLDLVPIPDTVAFGAMENPGLITYNTSLLLAKPDERNYRDRRSYAYVAAHEMAHQWFGNLITMAWWDDIWLNEAFASWMGDRVVHAWKPAWGSDVSGVRQKTGVMRQDALVAARRIREPVDDEHDVENAFDGITYTKGQAVLAMIEGWLGAETFQKGIRLYVERHARGSATYADLLAALAEVSGQDVSAVVDGFVDQSGVPLLRFTLVCEKGKTPRLDVVQRRFVPLGSAATQDRSWRVPVVVRWQAGRTTGRTTAVVGATASIELGDAPSCPAWVMPNADGLGYYLWALEGAPYERLRAPAVFKKLPARERLEVASSVSALVEAGELPYRRAVEMALTLVEDPEHRVRQVGITAGAGMEDWLPADVLPRYRAWVKKTYGPLAKKLGFSPRPGDSDDDRSLRVQVLWRMIGDADDAATQKEAQRLAWKWLDDRTVLAPEMVEPVLSMAAHAGDAALFERFLAEARKAHARNDKRERERFLGLLGGFRALDLADRARAMVLDDEFPVLETWGLLFAGMDSTEGRERAWRFVTEHYDAIVARLPRENRVYLVYVGSGDCTTASLERLQAFFAERTPRELGGARVYASVVESQTLCIAKRERYTQSFVEFLTGR